MENEKLDLSNKRMGGFLVGALFNVKTTKGFDKGNVSFETSGIEFIGRTNSRNGLQGFVNPILGALPNPGNTISISQIGAQTAQYRKNPWYSSQNIFILLDKIKVLNKHVKLYFITVLNKNLSKYSGYSSFPSLNNIKNTTLTLPIKEDSTPDYEWMDQYISQIKKDYIASLKQKKEAVVNESLRVADVDSYNLTEEESLFLDKWRGGDLKTGEFLVGDLFDFKMAKPLNKDELSISKYSKTPYITRTVKNNGINLYVDEISDKSYLNSPQELSFGLLGLESFYQKEPYYAGQFVRRFIPKFNMDENLGMFFKTCIDANKKTFQKYSIKEYKNLVLTTLDLTLPIKEDGTPDYEAMEQYILIMKKIAVKKLNQKYNDTISKTEEVVNNH